MNKIKIVCLALVAFVLCLAFENSLSAKERKSRNRSSFSFNVNLNVPPQRHYEHHYVDYWQPRFYERTVIRRSYPVYPSYYEEVIVYPSYRERVIIGY